jgi:hypothetical protein
MTPQVDDSDLFVWWQHAHDSISIGARWGFNTLVALGAWTLRKTRNGIVFNGASPRLDRALLLAQEEADLWLLAGKKDLVFWLLPAVLAESWDQCNGGDHLFVFQGAYVI